MQTLTGKVQFQFYYDVGGEIDPQKLSIEGFSSTTKTQKSVKILAPKFEEAGLKPVEISFGFREIESIKMGVSAKIFPIGVVEVIFTANFRNSSFEDVIRLVNMSEGFLKVENKEVEFEKLSAEIFYEIGKRIQEAVYNPYTPFDQPEVYRVVMISNLEPKQKIGEMLGKFRKQIAGILRGEKNWEKLSDREVDDTLRYYLSYSEDEAVVVDWYSALLIGGEEYVDEIVQTIEIAKIQLLELKTYDKLLDTRIDKAYGSLRGVFFRSRIGIAWLSKTYGELSRTASELAELRIEVVDYVHDLRNILKFTGDWYLGKLYSALSDRFRIVDWLSLVDKKLEQLHELYSMAMERVDVYRATTLEFLVLILIISLVLLEILMVLKL
ncbi:MAG: hypothetical protein QXQ38_01465 [Archaeoglobaceae archaeon]|nr:hypothetical protein [Archaeoglobales archaeon]